MLVRNTSIHNSTVNKSKRILKIKFKSGLSLKEREKDTLFHYLENMYHPNNGFLLLTFL